MRITDKQLESAVNLLNTVAGTPQTQYTRNPDGSTIRPNALNFHLQYGYGAVGLCQMCNEGTGVNEIFGYNTKANLFDLIHAMIKGIEYGKRMK